MDAPFRRRSCSGTNMLEATFVPDPIGGWVCPHCMMTPYHLRAAGSFSRHPPSQEYVHAHFADCFGLAASHQCHEQGTESGGRSVSFPSINSASFSSPQNSGWSSHNWQERERNIYQSQSFPSFQSTSASQESSSSSGWSSRSTPIMATTARQASFDVHEYHRTAQPLTSPVAPRQPFYRHISSPQPTFQNRHISSMESQVAGFFHMTHATSNTLAAAEGAREIAKCDEKTLVLPQDKTIITDYICLLFQQLQTCHFMESDRRTRGGKRDGLEVGFAGLQCRHCADDSGGSRKFFWTKVDRLASSFSEISGHVMKCHKCPDHVKEALTSSKRRHLDQMAKLKRGSQKLFFRRVWNRLHRNNAAGSVAVENSTRPLSFKKRPRGAGSSPGIVLATAWDKHFLSDLECSIRCSLEVFCASESGGMKTQISETYPITVNQVGIRCIYCASTEEGATGCAVMFPLTIGAIYESVHDFHRLHLSQCRNIPAEEMTKLSMLDPTKTHPSISRQHYIEAAKSLGMHDTSNGIRMRVPDSGGESSAAHDFDELQREVKESNDSEGDVLLSTSNCDTVILSPTGVWFQDDISDCSEVKESSEGEGDIWTSDNAVLSPTGVQFEDNTSDGSSENRNVPSLSQGGGGDHWKQP